MPKLAADDHNNINTDSMVASSASPKRSFQLILPASPRVLQQAKFSGSGSSGGGANTAFSSSSSSLSTLSLSLGNGDALLWQQLIDRLRQNHQLHHRHQNLHDVEQQIRTSSALYDPSTLSTADQLQQHQHSPQSPPLTPQSPGSDGTAELVEHIVRVTKGQYLNVGVPSFSAPGLCPYVYVHSVKRERRIIAQLVKYKKRSASPSSSGTATSGSSSRSQSSSSTAFCKPVYTTQKLSIPLNYAGFFEILSEDGRATRCIHSVSELLRRFPDACIVRSIGVRAYSPMVIAAPGGNITAAGRRPTGSSTFTGHYESLPNDGVRYQGDGKDARDIDGGASQQETSNVESDLPNVAVRFDKYRLLHPGERLVLVDSFKAVIENHNATTSASGLNYYRDYAADHQNMNISTVRGGQQLLAGSSLQVESFLRCFDEAGGTVLLHIGDKGKFSPIAREEQISGVHTVQNLLRKRFPLTVRLVCGAVPLGLSTKKSSIWPPLGSNASSSAAPTAAAFNSNSNGYVVPNSSSSPQPLTFAMRLLRCYEEEFAQVFVWSQKDPVVLSIPLSGTTLKVLPAKNMPHLRLDPDVRALSNNMLHFLTERGGSNACLQMLTERESVAHDVLTANAAAAASTSSLTAEQQFLSSDQLPIAAEQQPLASAQKRRTKKSSLLNLSAKMHSSSQKSSASKILLQSPPACVMQQQQPPLKWTYDEIDQIYDYVRGLAPPPATPFEIHEDDDDNEDCDTLDDLGNNAENLVAENVPDNYAAHNTVNSAAHVLSGSSPQQRATTENNNVNAAANNDDMPPPPPCYYFDAALGTYVKPPTQRNAAENNSPQHRRTHSRTALHPHDRLRNTTDSMRTSSAVPPHTLPEAALKYTPPPPQQQPPVPPPVETIPTHLRTYQPIPRAFHINSQNYQRQHNLHQHSASQDMLDTTGHGNAAYPTQYNYSPPLQQQYSTPPPPLPIVQHQIAAQPSSAASRRLLLFSKFKYKSMNQLPTMHSSPPPQQLPPSTGSKRATPFLGMPVYQPPRRLNDELPAVVARDRRGLVSVGSVADNDRQHQTLAPAIMMTPTSVSGVDKDEPPYVNVGSSGSPRAAANGRHDRVLNNNGINQHFSDIDRDGAEQQQQLKCVVEHEKATSAATTSFKSAAEKRSHAAESDAKLQNLLQQKSLTTSALFADKAQQLANLSDRRTCLENKTGDSLESIDVFVNHRKTVRVRLRPTATATISSSVRQSDSNLSSAQILNNNASNYSRVPFSRHFPTTLTLPTSHDGQPNFNAASTTTLANSLKPVLSGSGKTQQLSSPTPPPPIATSSVTKTFKTSTTLAANSTSQFLSESSVFLRNTKMQENINSTIKSGGDGVVVMRVRNSAAFDESLDADDDNGERCQTDNDRQKSTITPTVEITSTTNLGMFGKLKQVARVPKTTVLNTKTADNRFSAKTTLINRSSNSAAIDSGTGTASSSSASSAASLDGVGIKSGEAILGGGVDRTTINADSNSGDAERSVHARIQKFHNMLVGSGGSNNASAGCRKSDSGNKQQQHQDGQVSATVKSVGVGANNNVRRKVVGLIYV